MGLDMMIYSDRSAPSTQVAEEMRVFIEKTNNEFLNSDKVPESEKEKIRQEGSIVAYWRKHAPLHNYIVAKLAGGEDNCEPIPLNEENCKTIAAWLREGKISTDPDFNQGFFFGGEELWRTQLESRLEDAKYFDSLADWISKHADKRTYYQASW